MRGVYCADFINRNFNRMFEEADKEGTVFFTQDSDPSQNSAMAKRAMLRVQSNVIRRQYIRLMFTE